MVYGKPTQIKIFLGGFGHCINLWFLWLSKLVLVGNANNTLPLPWKAKQSMLRSGIDLME
jgi:hypothetical protein